MQAGGVEHVTGVIGDLRAVGDDAVVQRALMPAGKGEALAGGGGQVVDRLALQDEFRRHVNRAAVRRARHKVDGVDLDEDRIELRVAADRDIDVRDHFVVHGAGDIFLARGAVAPAVEHVIGVRLRRGNIADQDLLRAGAAERDQLSGQNVEAVGRALDVFMEGDEAVVHEHRRQINVLILGQAADDDGIAEADAGRLAPHVLDDVLGGVGQVRNQIDRVPAVEQVGLAVSGVVGGRRDRQQGVAVFDDDGGLHIAGLVDKFVRRRLIGRAGQLGEISADEMVGAARFDDGAVLVLLDDVNREGSGREGRGGAHDGNALDLGQLTVFFLMPDADDAAVFDRRLDRLIGDADGHGVFRLIFFFLAVQGDIIGQQGVFRRALRELASLAAGDLGADVGRQQAGQSKLAGIGRRGAQRALGAARGRGLNGNLDRLLDQLFFGHAGGGGVNVVNVVNVAQRLHFRCLYLLLRLVGRQSGRRQGAQGKGQGQDQQQQ